MISETIKNYDTHGKKTSKLSPYIKKYFKPTFPMGRYISQALTVECKNITELQEFLKKCSYVSDEVQFNKSDYWMPPEDFERKKKGDCEDFALWTWRQMLSIGYDARFVIGRAGRYGEGHAWVTYTENGIGYLCEPLAAWLSNRLPKLSTVRYEPYFSVGCDEDKLHYYLHKNGIFNPSISEILKLIFE